MPIREYGGSDDPVQEAEQVVTRQGMTPMIDDVREVGTTDDGATIVRVVYEDADTEADQIGFEVTMPEDNSNSLTVETFRDRVTAGLKALRNEYGDGEPDDDIDELREAAEEGPGDEPAADGDDMAADPTPKNTDTDTPDHNARVPRDNTYHIGFDVGLDDESLREIEAELDAIVDDIRDDMERRSELEERVDDIEQRLSAIEDQLSILSNALDPGGGDG